MKLSWKSKHLFLLLFLSFGLAAQDIPEPMKPYRMVNDFANIFPPSQEAALEQKLRAYNDSTSTQIYVVSVTDLGGYPASDYAFRLGEKWGIGQRSKNNGAVILVKPKTNNGSGEAFIATGYGLEARINDAYAGRIVRNRMIPHFKEGDYSGGVNAAVNAMIQRLSGEFANDAEENEQSLPIFPLLLVIGSLIILAVSSWKDRNQHIGRDGGSRNGSFFFPPFGGGGFGGGGFGGGGGGSFGGGGAGGSW